MDHAPIVLVPGFWLGAWAWQLVTVELQAKGHPVLELTLPGLDSPDTDRSTITLADHVDAICDAVVTAGRPVVLAVHSGTGFSGYAASDRVPDRIAAMVYVDSAPGKGAARPDFPDVEWPLPATWDELGENIDDLSKEDLQIFRDGAVPEPGGVLRESIELTNEARLDVPTTMICTSITSEQLKEHMRDEDEAWLAGLAELRNVTWVDLPTSHWPMWSKPVELAEILSRVAREAG